MMSTACSVCSLPMWLLLLLLLSPYSLGFSLERMCEARCMYGRGGNLCKCSAVHFAGKRNNQASSRHFLRLEGPEFKDSGNGNGGVDTSASVSSDVLWSAGDREDRLRDEVNDRGDDDDVMEGFLRAEGDGKSAVQRLASLLTAALDDRLIGTGKTTRKRHQSAVPYDTDDVIY